MSISINNYQPHQATLPSYFDVQGKEALETCLTLCNLAESGTDISDVLKSNNLMNKALNYCIENLQNDDIRTSLEKLLKQPILAQFATEVITDKLHSLSIPELAWLIHILPTSLKKLNLSEMKIENLNLIAKFNKLTSLNLSNCHRLKDLRVLKSFCNLKKINLNHCRKVDSITSLKDLTHLKVLRLEGCPNIHKETIALFVASQKDLSNLKIMLDHQKTQSAFENAARQANHLAEIKDQT